MSLRNKMCVQFTIFEESIETLERSVDICSLLKSENLSFVVCELLTSSCGIVDSCAFTESARMARCAKSTFQIRGTDSLYQQILDFGNFDCKELIKFNELINWIRYYRSSANQQSHSTVSLSSMSHPAFHIRTLNDVNNDSSDQNDVYCSTPSNKSLDDYEMSASMQAFVNSMDAFFDNPEHEHISHLSNSRGLGVTKENGDSILSVMQRIVDDVSQKDDTSCKGKNNFPLDGERTISRDMGHKLSNTDKDDSLSSPVAYDDDDDYYQDAASYMEMAIIAPNNDCCDFDGLDLSNHQLVPNLDHVSESMQRNADCLLPLEATFSGRFDDTTSKKSEAVPGTLSTNQNQETISDEVSSFATKTEAFHSDYDSIDESDSKASTCPGEKAIKRRSLFLRKRGDRKVPCLFAGCDAVLHLANDRHWTSRLSRHAQSHAMISCEHCDYTCTNRRKMTVHHRSAHPYVVIRSVHKKKTTRQESDSLTRACFPSTFRRI